MMSRSSLRLPGAEERLTLLQHQEVLEDVLLLSFTCKVLMALKSLLYPLAEIRGDDEDTVHVHLF